MRTGTAESVERWAGRPGFDSEQGKFLCHIRSVQTGSEAHPASSPMGTGGYVSGSKTSGAWSWSLAFMCCRGQEWWSYTFTPPYVFMAWCLSNSTHGQLHIFSTFYMCMVRYIHTNMARNLLPFVQPCFSHTPCRREIWQIQIYSSLEKNRWDGINFMATCMGSSTSQPTSPLPPSQQATGMGTAMES
jgi:hypothetical protein